jgi:hypothetical protein
MTERDKFIYIRVQNEQAETVYFVRGTYEGYISNTNNVIKWEGETEGVGIVGNEQYQHIDLAQKRMAEIAEKKLEGFVLSTEILDMPNSEGEQLIPLSVEDDNIQRLRSKFRKMVEG